jgi:hypothetical protein
MAKSDRKDPRAPREIREPQGRGGRQVLGGLVEAPLDPKARKVLLEEMVKMAATAAMVQTGSHATPKNQTTTTAGISSAVTAAMRSTTVKTVGMVRMATTVVTGRMARMVGMVLMVMAVMPKRLTMGMTSFADLTAILSTTAKTVLQAEMVKTAATGVMVAAWIVIMAIVALVDGMRTVGSGIWNTVWSVIRRGISGTHSNNQDPPQTGKD